MFIAAIELISRKIRTNEVLWKLVYARDLTVVAYGGSRCLRATDTVEIYVQETRNETPFENDGGNMGATELERTGITHDG